MFDLLNGLNLSPWQWATAAFSGLVIGASKSGITGVGFLAFPLLADIFGARGSTGVALPMLLLADIFAVGHYNRHTDWRHLAKLMPSVLGGLIVALIVGRLASDRVFGMLFAVTILVGIGIMLWRDFRGGTFAVPKGLWFSGTMGFSAGFATMIGNAAGPVMSLYLLSMRLPKDVFIGTGAWFYMIVNTTKVPLHLFVWQTISIKTVMFNLFTAPFIILGIIGGIRVVKHISEYTYRILVFCSVILAAVVLIVKFFSFS